MVVCGSIHPDMIIFSIIGDVVAGREVSGGWRSAMSENIVSEDV